MVGPPEQVEVPGQLAVVFGGKVAVRAVLNHLATCQALMEDDACLQAAELETQVKPAKGVDKEETEDETDE